MGNLLHLSDLKKLYYYVQETEIHTHEGIPGIP